MNSGWWLRIGLPAALGILAILALVVSARLQVPQPVTRLTCSPWPQPCRTTLTGQPVQIRFDAAPSALKPVLLHVTTAPAQHVSATFSMQDMDMGQIRYRLLASDGQHWQASVILPVCVSGRHDWLMTVDIDGRLLQIPFVA